MTSPGAASRTPVVGRSSTARHDWQFLGGSFDWHLYKCRRCGYEAFPSPFGFFWLDLGRYLSARWSCPRPTSRSGDPRSSVHADERAPEDP